MNAHATWVTLNRTRTDTAGFLQLLYSFESHRAVSGLVFCSWFVSMRGERIEVENSVFWFGTKCMSLPPVTLLLKAHWVTNIMFDSENQNSGSLFCPFSIYFQERKTQWGSAQSGQFCLSPNAFCSRRPDFFAATRLCVVYFLQQGKNK